MFKKKLAFKVNMPNITKVLISPCGRYHIIDREITIIGCRGTNIHINGCDRIVAIIKATPNGFNNPRIYNCTDNYIITVNHYILLAGHSLELKNNDAIVFPFQNLFTVKFFENREASNCCPDAPVTLENGDP